MDNNIIRVAVIGMTENKGGIESVMMNIYRNINREKIQFDFLIPYNKEEIAYKEEILALGGRIFNIVYPQRKSIRRATELYYNYFKNHPEVKVVHLNSNFPFAFPLKIAKKAGVPVRILHAHSSALLFEKEFGIKGLKAKIRNYVVKKQIGKYTNVFFSCSDLAAKSTFGKHDYVWIKNGIELDDFAFDYSIRNSIREEYNIKDDEIVIGFIGRLSKFKNPEFAIEVFNKYLKYNLKSRLVLVGDGDLIDSLKEKCRDNGIEEKVVFVGMISNTNLWYQAFDLLLMPSKFEGLPVVAVEAQASGLPCILSDTITKQVKLTDDVEYLSLDTDTEIWAKQIDKLLEIKRDRKLYKEKIMKKGFSVGNMVRQVEDYYLSIGDKQYD